MSFVIPAYPLMLSSHIMQKTAKSFHHQRCLHSIRRQPGRDATAQLILAPVSTWFDYRNAVMAGLLSMTLRPLQQVMNAAARLVST
jgi:hypothetical protein